MTFSKGLLIATLSLALFAFSAPVNAATETKPAEATKTDAAAQPAATNTAQEAPAVARMQQKVDIKNLPKDVSRLLPQEEDTFILDVGETKIITAARPRKCPEKDAPSFEDTKIRLPISELISYSDGGIRERFSRRCDSPKPARVILATGTKKGTQKLEILGAMLTIIVK